MKVLDESGLTHFYDKIKTEMPTGEFTFVYDGDKNSEANKEMFDKLVEALENGNPVEFWYSDESGVNTGNHKVYYYTVKSRIYYDYNYRSTVIQIPIMRVKETENQTINGINFKRNKYYVISYQKSTRTISDSTYISSDPYEIVTPSQLIGKDNTTEWTPTQNYGLVHKKYVDDAVSAISVPTTTSELTNDSGFVDEATVQTMIDMAISTSVTSALEASY